MSMRRQRYEWELGPRRPTIWSDEVWATFDRLVTAGDLSWVKAAYNPQLFWLTPSVLDWIAAGLDQGAAADSNGVDKTVHLSFDDWSVTAQLADPDGTDATRLSTDVGPLRASREMDRMLADLTLTAPISRRVHRSNGQLSVQLTVPLSSDARGDLAILDAARRELTAQGVEAAEQAYGDLLDEWVRVTLAAPPIPVRMQTLLRRHDAWVWSTRSADRLDPFQEYLLDDWTQDPVEDFVTLSHAGHGVNSYGLTLSMAYGPVALMVQSGWGGVFGGPIDNGRLAELYAHVAAVVRAVEARQPPPYTEPQRRPVRIVYSTFRDDMAAHWWDPVNRSYNDLELHKQDPWEPLIALAAGTAMPH